MRYLIVALILAASTAIGFVAFQSYRTYSGSGEAFGAPFALTDQNGAAITEADFRAQASAVFFGFTHCPEVCPTTLFELDGLLKQLGPEGEKIRAFFVSVDPERDTAEVMNQYVSKVSDRITGVTGTPEQIAAMLKSYAIYARKVPLEDGDYTMDHTASVLLLEKGGGFAGTIAYGESSETALAKLRRLAEGA
jgi:protein SCO1